MRTFAILRKTYDASKSLTEILKRSRLCLIMYSNGTDYLQSGAFKAKFFTKIF